MPATVSHRFSRLFQLNKLQPPRDFQPLSTEFWQKENVCLEIGAGKGKHAVLFANDNPQYQLIAIERTLEKFQAMQKLANQANLSNLIVIHADAIAWSVSAIPKNSLSKIFILYPNPEPHNPNQRFLNMPFFEFLLSRLNSGGEIVLASNISSYIDEAENMATHIWQLIVNKSLVPINSQRTHFEIKYLARGETCWQLSIIKPDNYQTNFD